MRWPLGLSTVGLLLDLALTVLAAAVVLSGTRRSRRGRSRIGWSFQLAAVLLWALAPVAWLTGLPDQVATAGRAGFVVATAVGWWLASLSADRWSRVRLGVDAGLAAMSAFVVGWPLLLAPVWTEGPGGFTGGVLVALGPAAVGAAVLATGVGLTEIRQGRRVLPLMWAAGLVVVSVSDALAARGSTALWGVGMACVVVASLSYPGTSPRQEVDSTRRTLVHVPYLLIGPAAVALVVQHSRDGVDVPVAVAAVAVVLLVLVRQHVTLSENRGLVERLAVRERELQHRATHDPLTGLPGRVLLYEMVESRSRDRDRLAVVFLDLDGFKAVNDAYGHGAGDDVLVEVAERIRSTLRPLGPQARAYRISGDEFAVVLLGAAAGRAAAVAGEVLAALTAPMSLAGADVRVGASLGVALGQGGVGAPDLLSASDAAMYRAKRQGGGVVVATEPCPRPAHVGADA